MGSLTRWPGLDRDLKKGYQWSNGKPVTTDNMLYTFETLRTYGDPRTKRGVEGFNIEGMERFLANEDPASLAETGVKAIDDRTFSLAFTKPKKRAALSEDDAS